MVERPFSPWRQPSDEEEPLEDEGEEADQFRPYSQLYRALLPVMSPSQVDDCELWQIAALLGVDEQVDADLDLGPSPSELDERRRRESHTLATRVARRRGQRDDM